MPACMKYLLYILNEVAIELARFNSLLPLPLCVATELVLMLVQASESYCVTIFLQVKQHANNTF